MSALDQPILIANGSYHVGHQMSVRVAEEQGFLREEGLKDYVYESGGLVPGLFERDALPLVLKERGVDIATAINVDAVVIQRSRGADLYIVGAWRHMPRVRLYSARQSLEELRGARIGAREPGEISEMFIAHCLSKAGVDVRTEIQWVYNPAFAYKRDPTHMEMLLSGDVDAAQSNPPFLERLASSGFRLLLDSAWFYPEGRPGKAIVASSKTIEHRGDELRAFLRANLRGFWFVRDMANFELLRDLELRLRDASHNEDERTFRMITTPDKLEDWVMPATGAFVRDELERVVDEMVTLGKLDAPLPVEQFVRDAPAVDAYETLASRPELQSIREKALAAAAKHAA